MSDDNSDKNDYKDEKDRDPMEQASSHVTIHIHAVKDEEENVRGTVLCEEKGDPGKRKSVECESDSTDVAARKMEYIVLDMIGQTQPPPGFGPPPPPPPGGGYGYGYQPGPQYPPQPGYAQPLGPQYPPPTGGSGGFMSVVRPRKLSGTPLDYSPDYDDRNAFVRLVFTLVLLMLLGTTAFLFAAIAIEPLNRFFRKVGMLVAVIFMIPLMGISYGFFCSECSRSPPMNIVLLVLTTIFQSLVCAGISCRYSTPVILMAAVVTVIVVMVCLGLACTNFDFTRCMLVVLVASIALGLLMLVTLVATMMFGVTLKPLMIAVMVGLTLLQCVSLIMELQMILGGRSIEISKQDYALAAYMVYTSVIEIFLDLLWLFGLDDC